MAPTYLKEHHGAVWYQRPIPKSLQHRHGGTTLIHERLGHYPKGKNDKAARAEALRRSGEDDKTFRDLARAEAAGQLEGITDVRKLDGDRHVARRNVRQHVPALALAEHLAAPARALPLEGENLTTHDVVRMVLEMQKADKAKLAALEAVPLSSAPAAEFGWDALYQLWVDVAKCKTTRAHVFALKLLKSDIGNVDYRHVSRDKALAFRDHLASPALAMPVSVQKATLFAVKGFYKAALKKGTITKDERPFVDVVVLGTYEVTPRDAFTPAQLRTILAATIPARRPLEVSWALQVMAHTGMRPGEVTQLQRGDLKTIQGKRAIMVCETCTVTGKRHPQKTVKTGEARNVPVVPALDAFYEWATSGGDPAAFVFECFPWNVNNKRVQPIGEALRQIMTAHNIVPTQPGMKLDGYCFRGTFSAMGTHRNLNAKHLEYVVGHAPSLHDKYGRGSGFVYLWDTCAAVRPFED